MKIDDIPTILDPSSSTSSLKKIPKIDLQKLSFPHPPKILNIDQEISKAIFSETQDLFYLANSEGKLSAWSLLSSKNYQFVKFRDLNINHSKKVTSLQFSAKESFLISSSLDNKIIVQKVSITKSSPLQYTLSSWEVSSIKLDAHPINFHYNPYLSTFYVFLDSN